MSQEGTQGGWAPRQSPNPSSHPPRPGKVSLDNGQEAGDKKVRRAGKGWGAGQGTSRTQISRPSLNSTDSNQDSEFLQSLCPIPAAPLAAAQKPRPKPRPPSTLHPGPLPQCPSVAPHNQIPGTSASEALTATPDQSSAPCMQEVLKKYLLNRDTWGGPSVSHPDHQGPHGIQSDHPPQPGLPSPSLLRAEGMGWAWISHQGAPTTQEGTRETF